MAGWGVAAARRGCLRVLRWRGEGAAARPGGRGAGQLPGGFNLGFETEHRSGTAEPLEILVGACKAA